jgi:Nucleotidyltransferase of unknown function (DUF6036)
MEGTQIEAYLTALGEELARQGFTEPVRLLVVGGVFMVLEMGSRKATEDVDAILLDLPEMTDKPPTKEIKKFVHAKNVVASQHNIPRKWLNDVVKSFLLDYAPVPPLHHWKTFGALAVYFPPKEYILVSKLMTFRLKDYDDIQALLEDLHIETRTQAQALVDQFVPDKRWQAHYQLQKSLDEIF